MKKYITNCKANTIVNGIVERCTVAMENGKICAVGQDVPVEPGAEVLDASGLYVMPGMIDCHSHVGAMPLKKTNPGLSEMNEHSNPAMPYVRVQDSINPFDAGIIRARTAGFTVSGVLPGSANVSGGIGVSVKLRGNTVDEMVIPGSEQAKFALGENPKRNYGLKGQSPISRMGSAAILRKLLFDAVEYDKMKMESERKGNCFKCDFSMEALLPVVRGERRCRIHCHRADDIVTAIRIAREFHLDYVLEHVTEGYKIAGYLKQNDATCVLGPLLIAPSKMEVWELRLDSPAVLDEAGINICLCADDAESQFLPMQVGLMIRNGLSEQSAFESVTIRAAKVLGLEQRMGSLEVGKDADIAVFDGFPFSNMSKCLYTFIDGEQYSHV